MLFQIIMEGNEVFHLPKNSKEIQRVVQVQKGILFPRLVPLHGIIEKHYDLRLREFCPSVDNNHVNELLSLQDICMTFVATHAEYIDSLEGFPLQMGEQLWKKICSLGTLNWPSCSTQQILDKFSSAYPGEFLPSCKISNLVMINNFEEELKILFRKAVKRLDLSNAGLDDDHDLIAAISGFKQLSHLTLAKNRLSSKTLRIMFGIPEMMKKTTMPCLEYLDLSFNEKVTPNGIARYVGESKHSGIFCLFSAHRAKFYYNYDPF